MNMGTALTFALPEGWTLRQVATKIAREWLPPLRAVPAGKGAQWLLQPIVVESDETGGPLWEPGISTAEYEDRLNRTGLSWAIRAKTGRSKGTILAQFSISEATPMRLEMVCSQDSLPANLFDPEKLSQMETQGRQGADGLFTSLLIGNGFQMTSQ